MAILPFLPSLSKYLTAVLIALVLAGPVCSQEIPTAKPERGKIGQFFYNEKVGLKIDYFGELVLHPGLAAGIDYSLFRNKWFDLHWNNEIGGYVHQWNHVGLFLKTSIGTRFMTPVSVFVDLNFGGGYLHTFPQGKVYRLNDKGEAEATLSGGSPHFMPATSFLIGWDGSHKKNLPFAINLGLEAFMEGQFNHVFLPHIAARVGVIYKFHYRNHE